ncbi:hypothetical protein PORCRE_1748 [Porphyromonas crevioricanis JCM 15906]|uniref:Uncharacterized protein n=2 Tax=Porphyromonas crevioricanis TaxID=393921 RepID=A0A2X4PMC9_9PORP|nr:hypothetical protein HQ38_02830 [Porphyromonas crevioricanis]GAD06028.1 hypothetical protein PORCRE_1748 [Porphyromonas crevioricanis JCM 15906]SJZ72552.1 hypothetical protein SAMN02745203_00670 [Porphyromonas crevioricanis]SQH73525.1 Uncharacterised protein [Porphyromonas crevioricanis]
MLISDKNLQKSDILQVPHLHISDIEKSHSIEYQRKMPKKLADSPKNSFEDFGRVSSVFRQYFLSLFFL